MYLHRIGSYAWDHEIYLFFAEQIAIFLLLVIIK